MKLFEYKDGGRLLIKPVDKSSSDDLAMFSHCSEGMVAVTAKYYEENTLPLLMMHGQSVSLECLSDDEGAE